MTLECTHSNYIPYAYGRATRKYGLRVYNLVKFNVQCVDRYLGLWRAGGARGAQTARHAGTATGWRGEKYCTYYREKKPGRFRPVLTNDQGASRELTA